MPPGVDANSATIIMRPREGWPEEEKSSPVHHINGLPWRLVVSRVVVPDRPGVDGAIQCLSVALHCDATAEYELWRANVTVNLSAMFEIWGFEGEAKKEYPEQEVEFSSWERDKYELTSYIQIEANARGIRVDIVAEQEEREFTPRVIIELHSPLINDVTLVAGGQEFPANREVLAAYSTHFNTFFYGPFKGANAKIVELSDTNPEDFNAMLKIIHGISTEPFTVESVERHLEMAIQFNVKLVMDQLENFILSTKSLSNSDKMNIAKKYNLAITKETTVNQSKGVFPPSPIPHKRPPLIHWTYRN